MKLVFRSQAQAELFAARDWYEARARGLGDEFARAVDVAVNRVLRTPELFKVLNGDFRQCMLRRFPYSIVYRIHEDTLVVVSVFHHRRRSQDWHNKT